VQLKVRPYVAVVAVAVAAGASVFLLCFALLFFALLCFALVLTPRSGQLEPPTGDSVCLTSCRLTLQHALLLDLREF